MQALIIGHRGAAGTRPENTVCSIERAQALGASWIEVDVQPTRDHQLVITHDHEVQRCSDGDGRVDQLSLAELKSLDFGKWFSTDYAKQTILTLDELLSLATSLELNVNLEIKVDDQHDIKSVVKLVSTALSNTDFSHDRLLISSFDMKVLEGIRKQFPSLRLGVLSEHADSRCYDFVKRLNAYSCNLDAKYLQEADIHALQLQGVKVMVYTVNDPELYPWMKLVDGIFTDFPERFIV